MVLNDLEKQPYAVPGSWMSFFYYNGNNGRHPGRNGLYLRANLMPDSGGGGDAIFKFILLDNAGREIPFSIENSPGKLTLLGAGGKCEIIFDRADRLRFRNQNTRLRLATEPKVTSIPQILQIGQRARVLFCLSPVNFLLHLAPFSADASVEADSDKGWIDIVGEEAAMTADSGEYEETANIVPFDQAAVRNEQDFERFRAAFPALPEFENTRDQAAFLLWSLRVSPRGMVKRPGTLVSRVKMSGFWAWDHCFSALAASGSDPEQAYNDFMVMLDHADERSGIRDLLTPGYSIDIFTKPPIHGWIYSWMMRLDPEFFNAPERLNEVYHSLCTWQRYWTQTRDVFKRGIPCCFHGNDSGWDNSSVFLAALPLGTPDIQSYLVLQAETLADIAGKLKLADEEMMWQKQRNELLCLLLEKLSDGKTFFAIDCVGRRCSSPGDPLQLFLPLILGKRLPEELRQSLCRQLQTPGRFYTEFGLATENIASPIYKSDGYWRGPIWAPSTMIMVCALLECGQTSFARDLAISFCRLCKNQGFYENFDALTGIGLRDSAMSWTASVFMFLQKLLTTS